MDDANFLPNDLVECQRLVLAAFQEATQRERRVADAERQVAELSRVLDQTAASHEELIQKHQATVDELNALKRWAYGRRRERIVEGDGQQHLFDLAPPDETQTPAPARRKFFEATLSSPREAHQILEWIWQLYDIEDRTRKWSPEARQSLRKEEAQPVLDRIETYLAELANRALSKSALGKAVTYASNQWQALCRYTQDGRLTIDNNVSERTLRHQAIGRKNWLFLGSKDAGPRAAVLYTILAGAKRHHIEPWAYVRELLMRLHTGNARLEDMLPGRWAAQHPETVLTHRLAESRAKAANKRDRRHRRRALAKSR